MILGGIDPQRSFKFIMQRRESGQMFLERKKLDNVPGPGSMKPLTFFGLGTLGIKKFISGACLERLVQGRLVKI